MKKTSKQTKPANRSLDRSRAEQSLRNSELRYRRLFEAAQDGILILDAETGAITDVNPYLIDKLGYSREEFIGKKLWQVGAFKDIEASKDAFEALQKNKYIRYKDLPLKAKDGRLIQVEFVSNVYQENNQDVIQCNIRDITERKQAEHALRESDQRFRSLIENASDLILIMNPDYTIAYVSPSVERILGYTVAAVTGAKITDFVDPQDIPELVAATEQRVRTPGPSPISMRVRVRHVDGSWRTLEGMGSNLLDQPGVSGLVLNARDITESERAEKALQQSEKQYRALVEQAADGIFITDIQGRYLDVNASGCAMLGYTREEILGADYTLILLPADLAQDPPKLGLLVDGKILMRERIYKRKDGTVFPVEVSAKMLSDGRIQSIVRDITERKRAEETLRASHLIIEGIINTIPMRVFWKDKNLVYLGCNAVFARDAGFTDPKDVIGKDDYQMGWREQAELYRGDDRQVIESGSSKLHVEEPQTTPEGNIITLLTSKVPLQSSKGEVIGVLGTYMDITERKRAEDSLRESEERYHRLVELMPDGVIVHSEGRVVFANPGSARIIGAASFTQLTDKPVIEFVHPEHRELALKRIKESLGEGKPAPLAEEKFIRLDGTPIDVQVTAIPFTYDGKPSMLTVFDDITERKRAEEALRESERRFREILETVELVAVTLDTEGRITFCNDYLLRLTGHNRADVLGQNWFAMFVPPDLQVAAIFLAGVRQGTVPAHFENEILTASGERRLVSWSNTILRGAEGRVIGTTSIGEDITARKLAEEALRESEEKFRNTIQQASDGILICDEQGRIDEWNKSQGAIFGLPREKMVGTMLWDFLYSLLPEDKRNDVQYQRLKHAALNAGQTENAAWMNQANESNVVNANGEVKTVLVSAFTISTRRGPLYASLTSDITERKRAEEEIARLIEEQQASLAMTTRLYELQIFS